MMQHALVAYLENEPAGCGALKKYSESTAEIKRMFVPENLRGLGIAKRILKELENWATELKFSECILETGKKQFEAVGLYKSTGYSVIPNFGQYAGVEMSVCMKKVLSRS